LLPLDFLDDPSGIAHDATQWKFFIHARHEGGVRLRIDNAVAVNDALPLIRQVYTAFRE
jgi:hypothetical protein